MAGYGYRAHTVIPLALPAVIPTMSVTAEPKSCARLQTWFPAKLEKLQTPMFRE